MHVYKRNKILFLIMGTENKSNTERTKCGEKNNIGIRNYQHYVWHRHCERNLLLESPTFANGTPWFRGTQFEYH
jgi:hypothetical protein